MPQRNTPFPSTAAERDRWVVSLRGERAEVDPWRPYAFFLEKEPTAQGELQPIATVLLTNRECPWRCAMCDLWKNTLTQTVPAGAIPAQIDFALMRLPQARIVKLYNSGSFFDPRAIPVEDYTVIAQQLKEYSRVIVECHPALIGNRCLAFRNLLGGRLEIAMGLETANPGVLEKLNKKMTLEQFAAAANFLRERQIDLRCFILVQPPFMREEESLFWAERSLEFAFDCGATAASLIPTRGGNGAMEVFAADGQFSPPQLAIVEEAMRFGLGLKRGRVFVDLWDLQLATGCTHCYPERIANLQRMNMEQAILLPIACGRCGGLT